MIEGVTGDPFHEVVEGRVIEAARMVDTGYHHLDPEVEGWADVWVDDVNLAHLPCLTADQAGGGLVHHHRRFCSA